MRAFLDTNVIIDYLDKSRPSAKASAIIWEAARTMGLEVFVTTQSILDMVYVVLDTREDKAAIYQFIHWMINNINVRYIDIFDVLHALKSPHADFEDNAQLAEADAEGCDVFVTNDKKILNRTDLKPMLAMTPEQFVDKMMSQ